MIVNVAVKQRKGNNKKKKLFRSSLTEDTDLNKTKE